MKDPRRFIVAYAWPEELTVEASSSLIKSLMHLGSVKANRASFSDLRDATGKARRLKDSSQLDSDLLTFGARELLVVEEAVRGGVPRSSVALSKKASKRRCSVVNVPELLDLHVCTRIYREMGEYFTPVFGFSAIEEGINAFTFPVGAATSSDWDRLKRSSLLREGMSQGLHLKGRLHDVYEMNLLSEIHASVDVDGVSLLRWAEDREGTEFIELSKNQYIWIVPADVRESCRKCLSDNGVLFRSMFQ